MQMNFNFIAGQWQSADSNLEIVVNNPATGEIIGKIPNCGENETTRAIEAAANALSNWQIIGAFERAKYLLNIKSKIEENIDELAMLLTKENGKSITEAKGELQYGADYFLVYAEEAKRMHGEILTSSPGTKVEVQKVAVGVVAMITPWNFPMAMLARKMSAALAAGCTVIAKPDHQTPYSALALAKICEEVGLPMGVFNVVTGEPAAIAKTLMDSKIVKKMSFTGSTAVGKLLIEQSAKTVKKLSLELGGNAPFIVFEDADLEKAVSGAMASKYRNAGQTCVCTNRFLVHESIADKFEELLKEKVKSLKVGNGLEKGVQVGPLINQKAKDKVLRLIDDARKNGAIIEEFGDLQLDTGCFVKPTVISAKNMNLDIFNEEIFGPVAVVYRFKSEQEAIEMANNTEYGLASYFYSEDPARIERVKAGLEYGMIGVNSGRVSSPYAPFGGLKESGYGKEGGAHGLREYFVEKMSFQLY